MLAVEINLRRVWSWLWKSTFKITFWPVLSKINFKITFKKWGKCDKCHKKSLASPYAGLIVTEEPNAAALATAKYDAEAAALIKVKADADADALVKC